MKNIIFAVIFSAFPLTAWATGSAPLCVFGNGPPQCFYYTADECRSAAHTFNGICGPNNSPPLTPVAPATSTSVTPVIPPSQTHDVYDGLMDGIRLAGEGARANQSQQPEQSSKMSWDEAAKAIEASVGKRQVIYSCTIAGQTTLSTVPKVGCIVAGFGDQIP